MDFFEVAQTIENIIAEIDKKRQRLETAGIKLAEAKRDYDRALAITQFKLSRGQAFDIGGEAVQWKNVSGADKMAKGVIADREGIQLSLAESGYKAANTNIDCLRAQLNGYQSIFRHLDTT